MGLLELFVHGARCEHERHNIVTDYRLYTRNVKSEQTEIDRYSSHLAATRILLGVRVYCWCDLDNTSSRWLNRIIVGLKRLARNDTVDVCG